MTIWVKMNFIPAVIPAAVVVVAVTEALRVNPAPRVQLVRRVPPEQLDPRASPAKQAPPDGKACPALRVRLGRKALPVPWGLPEPLGLPDRRGRQAGPEQ